MAKPLDPRFLPPPGALRRLHIGYLHWPSRKAWVWTMNFEEAMGDCAHTLLGKTLPLVQAASLISLGISDLHRALFPEPNCRHFWSQFGRLGRDELVKLPDGGQIGWTTLEVGDNRHSGVGPVKSLAFVDATMRELYPEALRHGPFTWEQATKFEPLAALHRQLLEQHAALSCARDLGEAAQPGRAAPKPRPL